ncbi:unnamed protein product [Symbiodinium natans]|uniref:Uncharacterized protein n=1 Tax=Symbiodinium natans TaxID=878477 RepID=A0A812KHI9_9DINO|nr:unnamed protein product [Symbiodinium natans]
MGAAIHPGWWVLSLGRPLDGGRGAAHRGKCGGAARGGRSQPVRAGVPELAAAQGELATTLVVFRHVEAFHDFFVFDAYVKAWDRGRGAPKGTRTGAPLPVATAPAERTLDHLKRCHEQCRLVSFHPGFARWLAPRGGFRNGSQVSLDLMQKRVHLDPAFEGEPATIFSPGPPEVEVGPRQVCARLRGGSGICAWDLEDIIPTEEHVALPDNSMHRAPFPVVHLIRQVDLSGDNIITALRRQSPHLMSKCFIVAAEEANALRRRNAEQFRASGGSSDKKEGSFELRFVCRPFWA